MRQRLERGAKRLRSLWSVALVMMGSLIVVSAENANASGHGSAS